MSEKTRLSSAVMVRMTKEERAELHKQASSQSVSLQRYCRKLFGLVDLGGYSHRDQKAALESKAEPQALATSELSRGRAPEESLPEV